MKTCVQTWTDLLAWPTWVALGVGVLTALLVLGTARWHQNWTVDHPEHGDHKLHERPTVRVGGAVIFVGLLTGLVGWLGLAPLTCLQDSAVFHWGSLALGGLMLFALGLTEDITRAVSIRRRMLVAALVGWVAWYGADVRVVAASFEPLDVLLKTHPWFSMVFTVFAMTGLIHAMNIVDGLNGLLGGLALMVLSAIVYVAMQGHAWDIALVALVAAFAVLGFVLFNFPRAHLFSGDSGAYLIGFVLAVLLILLMKHHLSSAWFGLAVVIHPVVETLYSSWRRYRSGSSPTSADALHLHSLLLCGLSDRLADAQTRNAVASLMTLAVAAGPVVLSAMFAQNKPVLQLIIVGHVAFYWALYQCLKLRLSRRDVSRDAAQKWETT